MVISKDKNVLQAQQLQALEEARTYIENGQDVPNDLCRILFPPEKREYELTYLGKAREEEILSSVIAVPLQEDRMFPATTKLNDGEWINKLIFGENLQILQTLIQMKKDGKLKNADRTDGVRLIYIDPPFASKQDFNAQGEEQKAYADKLAGRDFLEWLRKRLLMIRELLADDGSLYVHLDYRKCHAVKLLLDEIFFESNFVNEIIWGFRTGGNTTTAFARKHATILMYTKTSNYFFNTQMYLSPQKYKYGFGNKHGYELKEIDGKWFKEAICRDVWDDIDALGTRGKPDDPLTGYPTQKPKELLVRIIEASSKQGDIVLDCFAGSGTTPAVAEKLGRRWIAIDVGKYAIYTMQKRLLKIQNIKPFILYSGGLYDAEKLNKFDSENWKLFALQLWGCTAQKKILKVYYLTVKKIIIG